MQTGQIILITAIVIGICIMALCIFITRYSFKNVFLAPRKTTEDAFELMTKRGVYDKDMYKKLKFEPLQVVSEDGYMLKGQYLNFFPEGKKVMLFVHGYTANHLLGLQFVDMYKAMGYNALLIDVRSHGVSGGTYPTYGIKEAHDIKRWVNALHKKIGKDVLIGIHGQSMGAATALMYGGVYQDVQFIIADCPYANAKEVLYYQFKKVGHVPPSPVYKRIHHLAEKRIGIKLEEASPVDAIMNSQVPVLFIHGTADRTIPHEMTEAMYEKRNHPADSMLSVVGAQHVEAYMVDKAGYEEAVQSFVRKQEHDHILA